MPGPSITAILWGVGGGKKSYLKKQKSSTEKLSVERYLSGCCYPNISQCDKLPIADHLIGRTGCWPSTAFMEYIINLEQS